MNYRCIHVTNKIARFASHNHTARLTLPSKRLPVLPVPRLVAVYAKAKQIATKPGYKFGVQLSVAELLSQAGVEKKSPGLVSRVAQPVTRAPIFVSLARHPALAKGVDSYFLLTLVLSLLQHPQIAPATAPAPAPLFLGSFLHLCRLFLSGRSFAIGI